MGFVTNLFFQGGINEFLFYAILLTVLFVLYFIFIMPFFAPIPILNRTTPVFFLIVVLSWILYFGRNVLVNVFNNPIYLSVSVVVILIIIVFIVTRKRVEGIGART